MVITIVVSMLLSFIAGVACTLKSVNLGLKWQLQINKGKEPELKPPISSTKESAKQEEITNVDQYSKEILNEWMHGVGEA